MPNRCPGCRNSFPSSSCQQLFRVHDRRLKGIWNIQWTVPFFFLSLMPSYSCKEACEMFQSTQNASFPPHVCIVQHSVCSRQSHSVWHHGSFVITEWEYAALFFSDLTAWRAQLSAFFPESPKMLSCWIVHACMYVLDEVSDGEKTWNISFMLCYVLLIWPAFYLQKISVLSSGQWQQAFKVQGVKFLRKLVFRI